MAADMSVASQAYMTAAQMGASAKVILSLFMAGIVESGMRNLNYGDRDSKGFLQQRPSQGWPNPTDVQTATRSYVSKAMRIDRENPGLTPGQLAQKVQISAYPEKYDKVSGQATALLHQVTGGAGMGGVGAVMPVSLGDGDSMADKALEGAKGIILKVTGAGLGLFLIGAGLVYMVSNRAQKQAGKAAKVLTGGGGS